MIHQMRRLTIVPALAAVFVLGIVGPAVARPGNGEGQSTFQMVCDGTLSTLTVGGGSWSAAHVQETGRKFIPRATHLLAHDEETGTVLFEEHDVKPSAGNGPMSVCIEELRMDGMHITFTVEGTLR